MKTTHADFGLSRRLTFTISSLFLNKPPKHQSTPRKSFFYGIQRIYDHYRGDGYRTQLNFLQSFFWCLDFDNGTLSPEEFENIFWKEAKRGHRHSFIICNSFSCSPDTPNKFRVILFYLRPARSHC